MMKNFRFLFMMLIGVGLLVSSCAKDKEAEEIIDNLMKGSVNLTIDGITYNKIASNVNHSLSDGMVGCYVFDLNSEGSFVLGFGPVPAVGETVTIDINSSDENAPAIVITGTFNTEIQESMFMAKSGTIKCISTDKYELDAILIGITDATKEYKIQGTVKAGVTE